jgi:hypothetical protein
MEFATNHTWDFPVPLSGRYISHPERNRGIPQRHRRLPQRHFLGFARND